LFAFLFLNKILDKARSNPATAGRWPDLYIGVTWGVATDFAWLAAVFCALIATICLIFLSRSADVPKNVITSACSAVAVAWVAILLSVFIFVGSLTGGHF